jgi:hypothetical protein
MSTVVLWADDDSDGLLALLPALFKPLKISIQAVASYDEALQQLSRAKLGSIPRYDALMADVILPRKRQTGTLARDLGMLLAERAVTEFGMSRVVFLSVVPHGELEERFGRLRRAGGGKATFEMFDKTLLLEEQTIAQLGEALSRKRNSDGAE